MARFSKQSTSEEVCRDLSDQIYGSRVLITGVAPGSLGGEAALQISRYAPALLVLAGRRAENLRAINDAIKAETPDVQTKLLVLDLSSQESVREAAEEVNALPVRIDTLINNAGVMATPYGVTKEGLEMQFAINHVGHFLFTNLILTNGLAQGTKSTMKMKVVNVSSMAHIRSPVRFDDLGFEGGKCYDKWLAYGQSKTANILFSVSLAEKLSGRGVKSFSVDPGRILTGIMRHIQHEEWVKAGLKHEDGTINDDPKFNWKTLSQGVATLIVAAYDPSIEDNNGSHLINNQAQNENAASYAIDPANAEKLWTLSENLVGQQFSY